MSHETSYIWPKVMDPLECLNSEGYANIDTVQESIYNEVMDLQDAEKDSKWSDALECLKALEIELSGARWQMGVAISRMRASALAIATWVRANKSCKESKTLEGRAQDYLWIVKMIPINARESMAYRKQEEEERVLKEHNRIEQERLVEKERQAILAQASEYEQQAWILHDKARSLRQKAQKEDKTHQNPTVK